MSGDGVGRERGRDLMMGDLVDWPESCLKGKLLQVTHLT